MALHPMKIVILAASAMLAACAQSTPDCADSRSVGMVREMLHEQFYAGIEPKDRHKLKIELMNIRTLGFDSSVGRYSCVLDMRITTPRGSRAFPLHYSTQLTSEGKLYVGIR